MRLSRNAPGWKRQYSMTYSNEFAPFTQEFCLTDLLVFVELFEVVCDFHLSNVPWEHSLVLLELDTTVSVSDMNQLIVLASHLSRPLRGCETLDSSFDRGISDSLLVPVLRVKMDCHEGDDGVDPFKDVDKLLFILVVRLDPLNSRDGMKGA